MPNILHKVILIIDDEEMILEILGDSLESAGFINIIKCANGHDGLNYIYKNSVDLVFLDLNLPDINGAKVLEKLNMNYPSIPVIIITGNNDLDSAINTINNGAYDYLQKPFNLKRIIASTKNALNFYELNFSFNNLKQEFLIDKLDDKEYFSSIITNNEKMFKLFNYIRAIAKTSFPLLITGETGVGKELFAKSVHDKSSKTGEFIPMDVSSYNTESFKDALFGHIKGAYTGAINDRQGLFKMAENGTLFLDEIGDLNLELQSQLLRVLQEQEYRQIGSDKIIKTNCRIIFATNRNLQELIECGKFRKDLYYRLETHSFEIPPLRKRVDDIKILFEHFVFTTNNCITKIPDDIYSCLYKYQFPGNVRELKNIAINAATLCQNNQILIKDIIGKFKKIYNKEDQILETTNSVNCLISEKILNNKQFPTLEKMSNMLIDEALIISNNNQSKAAQLLGISRQALNIRINKRLKESVNKSV